MNLIKKMFFELFISSLFVALFDAVITGVLFFSIIYFLAIFFAFDEIYAVGAGAFALVLSFAVKLKRNKVLEIEKKYPDLREKLRTSSDYKEQENMVVLALHTEVLNQINEVDVNAFINPRKLIMKVGAVCLLLFIVLMISVGNFNFFTLTNRFKDSPFLNKMHNPLSGDSMPIKETTDFLKDGKIAKLGDEQKNLSLDIYNTELDLNVIEPPKKNDYGGSFPEEISGFAQESYNEKISDEYKDSIKGYFDEINK
jgi:hypothetical protein